MLLTLPMRAIYGDFILQSESVKKSMFVITTPYWFFYDWPGNETKPFQLIIEFGVDIFPTNINNLNSLRPSDAYICVGILSIFGSDNGLSPGWHQAIIWTKATILLIGSLRKNFSEILIKIHTFSFKNMHLKMSGKWRPFCLGFNVLTFWR